MHQQTSAKGPRKKINCKKLKVPGISVPESVLVVLVVGGGGGSDGGGGGSFLCVS